MAWQDRPYYRDRGPSMGGPLNWIMYGSVPIGTLFGIHIRVHASLIVLAALTFLFPGSITIYGSFSLLVVLFCIVLLHEFGHCFASRMVGGDPRNIMMTPIGGLAFADAPKRPWATFWTVLGGPLVNVLICALCAIILLVMGGGVSHGVPWDPMNWHLPVFQSNWVFRVYWWTWWFFIVSYALLLFNLWPIFPLDGGQLLQSLLWVKFGYFKSMKFACITGMIGAVVMAGLGLATREILLIFIAVTGFMTCMQQYRMLMAMGPEEAEGVDFSASIHGSSVQTRNRGRSRAKLAKKRADQAAAEQVRIDAILAKVSAHGMHSLTWLEKRALRMATEHQRQRDLENVSMRSRR